ncbi:MAG: nitroreductase family protein [Archaeoglobaceae archaeon]
MDALEMISRRRSIRKYRDEEIDDDKIETLLKSAMYAPSAINEQPWHFIVVKDKDSLKELSKTLAYGKMLSEAAAAIVICADKGLCKTKEDFWVQDCSAATQNILLAATAMGIGSVWLGIYPNKDRVKAIADHFGVPENIVPFNVISLGYPQDERDLKEKPERFKKDRIHYSRW